MYKIFNKVSCRLPKFISGSTRSSQSIKIGKSDLTGIDCIDQSVEIDDILVSLIDLT